MWKTTKKFFKKREIEFVDAVPSLQQQLVLGEQPYQSAHDGHPNTHGHKAIAKLVYNAIQIKQKTEKVVGQRILEDLPL